MDDGKLLSVSEYAAAIGTSEQSVYQRLKAKNGKLSAYTVTVDGKTKIKESALLDVDGARLNADGTNTENRETASGKKEALESRHSAKESQPELTALIEQTKNAALERERQDERFAAIIAEKDALIKEQQATIARLAEQLSNLTDRVTGIAEQAIVVTQRQQALEAAKESSNFGENPAEESAQQPPQKKRLFGWRKKK